jgi:creatinine amidohydrolase
VAERQPVLLVPLGSTEQHGPHLPLDTDTRIAVSLAEAAATALAETGVDAMVAPALAFGASGEHQAFAGTLSIGQDALEQVVIELVRSGHDRFRLLVLVNGHGGNTEALGRAGSVLAAEGRPTVVWSPHIDAGDSHAGHTETSLMLAVDTAAVRLDRVEPGLTAPLGEIIDDLRAGGLAAVTPNGVLGDPTDASVAEGNRLLADLVADLTVTVATHPALATGEPEPPRGEPEA